MSEQVKSLNISSIAQLTQIQKDKFLAALTTKEKAGLRYDWSVVGRPKQQPPPGLLTGEYHTWFIMAGRGFGKTRTGAEFVKWAVANGYRHIAFVGRTTDDMRKVMIMGMSGILSVYPDTDKPLYEPSKKMVTFPNGAIASMYSADEPALLRGPNHDLVWADELAAWRYPDAWDMAEMGLRIGDNPLAIITTTPRPTKLIKALVKDPMVYVTTGTTYENTSLAPRAMAKYRKLYEGTRLGRQELNAELLTDVPGALWTRAMLDGIYKMPPRGSDGDYADMKRIVIAIDPAVTNNEGSNETGIIAAGLSGDGFGYVLSDVTLSGGPSQWANKAIKEHDRLQADAIVVEVNNGGDMLEHTIRLEAENMARGGSRKSSHIKVIKVRASRGKYTRAEPVAALYEQGRIYHAGVFALLDEQLTTWIPDGKEPSPDRLDALVWAFYELMVKGQNVVTLHKENPFTRRRG